MISLICATYQQFIRLTPISLHMWIESKLHTDWLVYGTPSTYIGSWEEGMPYRVQIAMKLSRAQMAIMMVHQWYDFTAKKRINIPNKRFWRNSSPPPHTQKNYFTNTYLYYFIFKWFFWVTYVWPVWKKGTLCWKQCFWGNVPQLPFLTHFNYLLVRTPFFEPS